MDATFPEIPPDHFLSLSRLDGLLGIAESTYDTSTLAAHDFDVDNRTGFMPPQPPPARLPEAFEHWEEVLDEAIKSGLQLGDKPGITLAETECSEKWRRSVRHLPILPIADLIRSETNLRRAHLVLAWVMHFYIHSLPSDMPIIVPAAITVPLFKICTQLQLPPVLTYSDTVLYNWRLKTPSNRVTPALDNLVSNTLFTGTNDEQEFYLTSARMELRGVEALDLMRSTMDEAFIGDTIAIRRITAYLQRLAVVIDEIKALFAGVRDGCDPWILASDDGSLKGSTATQTGFIRQNSLAPARARAPLIHALDVFLGVHEFSHAPDGGSRQPFLERMQLYMPRHHRNFLDHLTVNPRPLRAIVMGAESNEELVTAYNLAVQALKRFRDYHITIVTAYIIQPARKALVRPEPSQEPLKGTGGTDLARFLKSVRDQTAAAKIE
ncbi:Indoleamine 2,3-dioxygenase [Mycena indigotica]|uniref:Indoleamine 2,3-dioxygenase n=1 Tax=Mycena indigotica TaxID=2126181 RepID=A0A8H6TA05_9AGAR|nr:Indoleamine 2,3-dioxygenase [Mycena indigotica]KAF7312687.1 Indoleamine 2,3-dioxygenase [Mycena indigotica]